MGQNKQTEENQRKILETHIKVQTHIHTHGNPIKTQN